MNHSLRILAASAVALLGAAHPAMAWPQVGGSPPPIVTGSDGSDGAFVFVPDAPESQVMTIDLGLAASGLDGSGQPITWQTPSPAAGRGVYDPFAWAVVFKYTQVFIPTNATVQFRNHPAHAPVVWLVQGDVTLDAYATVSLDAKIWFEPPVEAVDTAPHWLEPGPGGFRGAAFRNFIVADWPRAAGMGPGGGFLPVFDPMGIALEHGNYSAPDADDRGPPYGGPGVFPLIGGSGSGGGTFYSGTAQVGGAPGGGAILIAAQALTLRNGSRLRANGSVTQALWTGSSGSGGAIRLVASTIRREVGSHIYATARGSSSLSSSDLLPGGRVRLEAHAFEGSLSTMPPPSIGAPSVLLPDASTPAVRFVSVQMGARTHSVASDPRSSTEGASADVLLAETGTAIFHLEARNVAPGRTVLVRVTNIFGNAVSITSTPLVGTLAASTATASVSLSEFFYAVQARVIL